jgi:3-oxocholest-4-en-26-oate---CoA ligase
LATEVSSVQPTKTFNLGDLFETIADAVPDRLALITNTHEFTYAELDERINRLANHLLSVGIQPGDHVAVHAANCHEWMDAFFACFKVRAVPINVNYRYVATELRYVYDNANVAYAIVGAEYTAIVEVIRPDLPQLRGMLSLGAEYDAALAAASPARPTMQRSDDDLYLLYTGGTTGMPKGVMWRSQDVFMAAMNAARANRPVERIEQLGEEAAASTFPMRMMALGPMMHGGAQWLMGNAIFSGGTMVLSTAPKFDPHTVWSLVERSKANTLGIIGDGMARPLAEALLEPDAPTYDLSMFFAWGNGGAPLSTSVREQLKQAVPHAVINDSFGASETGAAGSKIDDGQKLSSPRFTPDSTTTVLGETGIETAVGEVGKLARCGHIPLGYYGDPDKTAATFPTFAGKRWVIPGDFAVREDDGSITLLGRGSGCINSGGEKIFPEEVEAALRSHPDVFDAVVVGTPHPRWVEQVTAMVKLRNGATATTEELVRHARTLVADYKSPKSVLFIDEVRYTPVGKLDYAWAKQEALRLLAATDR